MTVLALLFIGGLAAAGTAWALPRDGAAARVALGGGLLALALMAILAAVSATPTADPDATGAVPGTAFNGAVVPGGYLRLVVVLAAASSILMCAIAWLLRGLPGLRGLLPASLAALVGTTVALGASTAQLGIAAAGATGLVSIPVLLATPRPGAAGVAAREVRIAVATALVVLAVASVLPLLVHLAPASTADGAATAGNGMAAVVAFGLLAVTLVVAARVGAIPFHVRVSALTDTAPDGSLPLVLVWLPLPLAAISAGVVAGELAPLGLAVGSAQALIVVLVLLATVAGGLAAAFQDDLRHAVGYLTLADLGLVVLAFAALDPAATAWGPARTWLLTVAVTKTALAAWAAVAEDRYKTRSVPDLRGWLRPSPPLGLALVLIVVATYGLPGWAVFTARLDLTRLAAEGPLGALLLVASLLTLPAYARWLWLGIAAPTSRVDGGTPELLGLRARMARPARLPRPSAQRRGHEEGLPVEQESDATPLSKPTTTARPDLVSTLPAQPSPARPKAHRVTAPLVQPGLFDLPDGDSALARDAGSPRPAQPDTAASMGPAPARHAGDARANAEMGDARAVIGVGRRARTPGGPSGSSAITTPRAPGASKALPSALLAADRDTADRAPDGEAADGASPDGLAFSRRRGTPSGPDAAARAAASLRRHRTDLLSAAVLALALLAALVASGVFGVSAAACEPTPAVPAVSCSQG